MSDKKFADFVKGLMIESWKNLDMQKQSHVVILNMCSIAMYVLYDKSAQNWRV